MNKNCYIKRRVLSLFIAGIMFILTAFVASAEALTSALKVVPTVTNNKVSVAVNYLCSDMGGGSFNFVYDTSFLKYVSVEEGGAIKNTTHFVNPEFAPGTIRINWVSVSAMPVEGNLVTVNFEITGGAFKKSLIGIESLKVADSNGDKQDAEFSIDFDEPDSSAPSGNGGGNSSSVSKPASSVSSVIIQKNQDKKFSDVNTNDWFYKNVEFVTENKLMNGISDSMFAPNETLTRAMLVTVLYRNAGEPAVNKSIPFADADMGSWYANAVIWAKQNGIVNGVNDTEFAPEAYITREQIAAIMFRYAQYKGMEVVTSEENLSFTDADEISEYAVPAMNWAVGTGLINGKSSTTLNPKDNATRAEIAAILRRFIQSNK